jgi:hypothetical protein
MWLFSNTFSAKILHESLVSATFTTFKVEMFLFYGWKANVTHTVNTTKLVFINNMFRPARAILRCENYIKHKD